MDNFRDLTPDEEREFREWARENFRPFTPISAVWHPVVQDECRRMNREHYETVIAHVARVEEALCEAGKIFAATVGRRGGLRL